MDPSALHSSALDAVSLVFMKGNKDPLAQKGRKVSKGPLGQSDWKGRLGLKDRRGFRGWKGFKGRLDRKDWRGQLGLKVRREYRDRKGLSDLKGLPEQDGRATATIYTTQMLET